MTDTTPKPAGNPIPAPDASSGQPKEPAGPDAVQPVDQQAQEEAAEDRTVNGGYS